jgi:N-acetylmuramoyl-L-alanine amidase
MMRSGRRLQTACSGIVLLLLGGLSERGTNFSLNQVKSPLAEGELEMFEVINDCKDNFKVALDVGHTPENYGTRTAHGRTEYEFNLKLAKFIQSSLSEQGYKNIYLINIYNGPELLLKRDLEANKLNANLLISIHHDSVQQRFLKTWTVNGKTEEYSDKFSGFSLFVSEKTPYWREALFFATLLADQLLSRKMHFTLHHVKQEKRQLFDGSRGIYKFDDLVVLKGFKGAAVLLEAAVIVNRQEELVADSLERHELIADAMVNAIKQFCVARIRQPSNSAR